jgi:5'-nucleotidase / UDP-sugar diphosphatase
MKAFACRTMGLLIAAAAVLPPEGAVFGRTPGEAGGAGTVTILHTNDMHAQYLPAGRAGDGGGLEALDATVRAQRNGHSLLLDAGDTQTGTLLSRLTVDGALGGGMIRLMNLIGYDACAPGNHDFDEGWQNLIRLSELARFDVLSANLKRDGAPLTGRPFRLFDVGGVRVGVIGLTTADLVGLVAPGRLDGIRVVNPADAAREVIRQIDPETDLIVLLTHEGFAEDSLLALAVPEADVIIGGHSHTPVEKPIRVNGVIICQAGCKTRFLGRLDLDVAGDRVVSFTGRLLPVRAGNGTADTAVTALVSEYRRILDAEYGGIIGRVRKAWTVSRNRECNAGDLFADAVRNRTGTDFAALNTGGIRRGQGKGPLRKMDLLEVYPFENRLVRFSCTGRELLSFIRKNADAAYRGEEICQISGLRYETEKGGDGKIRITGASIGGKAIEPDRTYSGTAPDYVVPGNARRFLGFEPKDDDMTGVLVTDAAIEWIRQHPSVDVRVDGRMKHR